MRQASWYPDPAGRFPQRFFDGQTWLELVRDHHGMAFDAAPAAPPPTDLPCPHPPAPPAAVTVADRLPAAAPPDTSSRRSLAGRVSTALVVLGGLLVLVTMAAAVVPAAVAALSAPDRHTVTGELSVPTSAPVLTELFLEANEDDAAAALEDLVQLKAGETFACPRLPEDHADVGVGDPVRVADASGTVLATASLEGGVLELDRGCTFTFTVEVPPAEVYRFSIGDQGEVGYSRTELEGAGWQVHLRR